MPRYYMEHRDGQCAIIIEKISLEDMEALTGKDGFDPGHPAYARYIVHTSGMKKGGVSVTLSLDPYFQDPIGYKSGGKGLRDFVRARWHDINKMLGYSLDTSCLEIYPQKFKEKKKIGRPCAR